MSTHILEYGRGHMWVAPMFAYEHLLEYGSGHVWVAPMFTYEHSQCRYMIAHILTSSMLVCELICEHSYTNKLFPLKNTHILALIYKQFQYAHIWTLPMWVYECRYMIIFRHAHIWTLSILVYECSYMNHIRTCQFLICEDWVMITYDYAQITYDLAGWSHTDHIWSYTNILLRFYFQKCSYMMLTYEYARIWAHIWACFPLRWGTWRQRIVVVLRVFSTHEQLQVQA